MYMHLCIHTHTHTYIHHTHKLTYIRMYNKHITKQEGMSQIKKYNHKQKVLNKNSLALFYKLEVNAGSVF